MNWYSGKMTEKQPLENTYRMRNILLTLGSIIVLGVIVYVSFLQKPSYTNLSDREVKSRMDSGKNNYVLVDVRTPLEYTGELGHLPGAVLYPIQNINIQYQQLNTYKKAGKDLIVYCRSGNRSRRVAQFLIDHGFTDVYNMEGGMRAWNRDYGRPGGSDSPPPNLQD